VILLVLLSSIMATFIAIIILLYTSGSEESLNEKWWNKKLGKANAAVAKATLKQTCTLEREHATLTAAHVFTQKTGENACHAKL
jgi:hypothetical protein